MIEIHVAPVPIQQPSKPCCLVTRRYFEPFCAAYHTQENICRTLLRFYLQSKRILSFGQIYFFYFFVQSA